VESAENTILHSAVYYIHFLIRDADNSDDGDVICDRDYDAGQKYLVRLQKLLTFSCLQKSCEGDVTVLR